MRRGCMGCLWNLASRVAALVVVAVVAVWIVATLPHIAGAATDIHAWVCDQVDIRLLCEPQR